MKTYGLIGKKLDHSFSQKYFTSKFQEDPIDAQYLNFELASIDELDEMIQKHRPEGFNVTIPYKEEIIAKLESVDAIAQKIGAVNTVKVNYNKDGGYALKGFNTDAFGFGQLIKPFFKGHHERALILGTGGASKAVEYVLKNLGVTVLLVSRSAQGFNQISYSDLNQNVLDFHPLIVNTTPVGTFPNENNCPDIPYEFLSERSLLVDLVYNPSLTQFMQNGMDKGAKVINGLTMLHQQAEKAWQIFNQE
jgi:shikimate dehydrogenase